MNAHSPNHSVHSEIQRQKNRHRRERGGGGGGMAPAVGRSVCLLLLVTDHACDDNFIKDVMNLVYMEDEIEFAHIFKAFVQCFHEHLNQIQDAQLRFTRVHGEDEVQSGV